MRGNIQEFPSETSGTVEMMMILGTVGGRGGVERQRFTATSGIPDWDW